MSNKSRLVLTAMISTLMLWLCAGTTEAQISSANYTFVVASGFLCNLGESGTCPAVATSANGDNYEISGAGAFDMRNKSLSAAGTFAHKAANGTVVDTGVWLATELESFVPYGFAPGALRKNRFIPFPRPRVPGLPKFSEPMATGGLALFHIRLLSNSGSSETAVLQVNCALGAVPHERSVEGIRLTVGKGGSEFFEEAGGRVIFLAMRSE